MESLLLMIPSPIDCIYLEAKSIVQMGPNRVEAPPPTLLPLDSTSNPLKNP